MNNLMFQIKTVDIDAPEYIIEWAKSGRKYSKVYTFTLPYPSKDVASVTAIKVVQSDKTINKSSDFNDSLIFKVGIHGPAQLQIEAGILEEYSTFDKIINTIAKDIAGAAITAATDGIASIFVKNVSQSIGSSVIQGIFSGSSQPISMAKENLYIPTDISSFTLEHSIDFKASDKISPPSGYGEVGIIPEGQIVGNIVIDIANLD